MPTMHWLTRDIHLYTAAPLLDAAPELIMANHRFETSPGGTQCHEQPKA